MKLTCLVVRALPLQVLVVAMDVLPINPAKHFPKTCPPISAKQDNGSAPWNGDNVVNAVAFWLAASLAVSLGAAAGLALDFGFLDARCVGPSGSYLAGAFSVRVPGRGAVLISSAALQMAHKLCTQPNWSYVHFWQ